MSAADVSVCIVTWNTMGELHQCLDSLLNPPPPLTLQIIVVDNASTDGTAAMIAAQFPEVLLIRNAENVGFARANNQAFRRADGRYLLLLNSDTVVRPGAVATMVAFMNTHPDAGALGCRLLNPDGSAQRSSWRGFPSLQSSIIEELYLWRLTDQRHDPSTATAAGAVTVDHLLGACIMVPREIVQQVGEMNEGLFLFLEETEWCYRIRRTGLRIYFLPTAEMVHLGQRSVNQFPSHTLPLKYRNLVWFCRTYSAPSRPKVLALKLVIAIGALLRTGLWTWRAWHGESRAHAQRMRAGYWQVFRQIPSF